MAQAGRVGRLGLCGMLLAGCGGIGAASAGGGDAPSSAAAEAVAGPRDPVPSRLQAVVVASGIRAARVLAGAGAAVRVDPPDARIGCAPRTDNLPPKATAGIECVVGSDLVNRVGVYAFATPQDALAAYIARMAGYGVALRGDCAAGNRRPGLDAGTAPTRAATSRGGPAASSTRTARPTSRTICGLEAGSGRSPATSAFWVPRRRSSRSSTGRTRTRTASTRRCRRRRGSA